MSHYSCEAGVIENNHIACLFEQLNIGPDELRVVKCKTQNCSVQVQYLRLL